MYTAPPNCPARIHPYVGPQEAYTLPCAPWPHFWVHVPQVGMCHRWHIPTRWACARLQKVQAPFSARAPLYVQPFKQPFSPLKGHQGSPMSPCFTMSEVKPCGCTAHREEGTSNRWHMPTWGKMAPVQARFAHLWGGGPPCLCTLSGGCHKPHCAVQGSLRRASLCLHSGPEYKQFPPIYPSARIRKKKVLICFKWV